MWEEAAAFEGTYIAAGKTEKHKNFTRTALAVRIEPESMEAWNCCAAAAEEA